MHLKILLALGAVCVTISWQVEAQTYDTNLVMVQTFAGSGFYGYLDGVGQQTMFNWPREIVADSRSNLYVWDSGNFRIRKIAPDGSVSTFVGGGAQTTGTGTNVGLGDCKRMTIDRAETLWLLQSEYLYKITSNAVVTRNSALSTLIAADGACSDSSGNLYFSDRVGRRIHRYSTIGVLSAFAGSGNQGYADGNGIFTAFDFPGPLASDAANYIYVWEEANRLIRRIDQSQNVTTFAGKYLNSTSKDGIGTNAVFDGIGQMCTDGSGNLLLACFTCIRKVSAQRNVTTIAGSFSQSGYTNGAGNLARFSGASGVCVSGGTIFVAESGNHRIRSITYNPSPEPVLPPDLQINTYPGLKITGIVGRTYRIESSPDTTDWTTRTTLVLSSSPYLWIDQNPAAGIKFYRALLLP
jgi:hypothetical protein